MNTALSCLSFRNVQFDVVDRNGQPWLTSPQIGEALGYTKGSVSVHKLYEANADEFTEAMTALVKLPPRNGEAGQMREVRIFSLRGCHLLGMFARTKPAKEFRKWVLDVLEQHSAQAQPQPPANTTALAAQLAELLQGKVLVDYHDLRAVVGGALAARNVLDSLEVLAKRIEAQVGEPLVEGLLRELVTPTPAPAPTARPLVPMPGSRALDTLQTTRILTLWHQELGSRAYRAAEVVKRASSELTEAMADVAIDVDETISTKRLGKWLLAHEGQVVDGLCVFSGTDTNRKVCLWAVQPVAV